MRKERDLRLLMRSWLSVFSLQRVLAKSSGPGEQNINGDSVIETRDLYQIPHSDLGYTHEIAAGSDLAIADVEIFPKIHILTRLESEFGQA